MGEAPTGGFATLQRNRSCDASFTLAGRGGGRRPTVPGGISKSCARKMAGALPDLQHTQLELNPENWEDYGEVERPQTCLENHDLRSPNCLHSPQACDCAGGSK